jgi:hypothetical protein
MIAMCVNDRDPNVRHAICRNASLTTAQRQQLQQDIDPLVARAATKPPKEIQYRQRPGQTRVIK